MQARTLCAILLFVAGIVLAASAKAGDVLRWVDADGVTHFGDHNAAPAAGAKVIEIQRANGMLAPDTTVLEDGATGQRIALQRSELKNKRGWRGYEDNIARNKGRGARRNQRY